MAEAAPTPRRAFNQVGRIASARVLQWLWFMYIPSFTATGILIFLFMVLKYIAQVQFLCRAHDWYNIKLLTINAVRMQQGKALIGSGDTERQRLKISMFSAAAEWWWGFLGVASAGPMLLLIVLFAGAGYMLDHPLEVTWCATQGGVSWLLHGFVADAFAEKFFSCLVS